MIGTTTFAAIDFESAGASSGMTDVPVQIGMAMWSIPQGHHSSFVSYLQCNRPVTWSAQKVHGIESSDLHGAPPLMTLWPQIKNTLGGNIAVAHGHGTEKRYLRAFPGSGFGPWVDTLLLARAAWPELQSHALGDLCEEFSLTETINELVSNKTWHDALYDAVASLVLLEHIIDVFQLAERPLDLLLKPDLRAWHQHRNSN